jgi:hypothetical protein
MRTRRALARTVNSALQGGISFDGIADAHRRIEAGGLNGKLVLCPELPP